MGHSGLAFSSNYNPEHIHGEFQSPKLYEANLRFSKSECGVTGLQNGEVCQPHKQHHMCLIEVVPSQVTNEMSSIFGGPMSSNRGTDA